MPEVVKLAYGGAILCAIVFGIVGLIIGEFKVMWMLGLWFGVMFGVCLHYETDLKKIFSKYRKKQL